MGSDRARQFLPFDALRGYNEAIRTKEKVVVKRPNLTEEQISLLSYKLSKVEKNTIIKVIYVNNEECLEVEGMVSNIDMYNKTLTIVKCKIKFIDILDISAEYIKDDYDFNV